MFTITVDDDITLHLIQEHHHPTIFELIENNKAHLEEFNGAFDNTLEDVRRRNLRAKSFFAEDGTLILHITYQGQPAGSINLHYRTGGAVSGAEIGYWLAKKFVGKGIMTRSVKAITDYVFAHWDVNRVFMGIATNNPRSYAIAERLGFAVEGTLRQNDTINGEWVDHRLYTMLKDEWTLSQDPPILHYSVDDNLELRLVEKRHARSIFDLSIQNREHIGEWLSWIDNTHTVDDTMGFTEASLEQYGKNDGFQAGIWYNNQLVGMIGYLYWDFTEKHTEIGYWLAKDATGHGIMTKCTRALTGYALDILKLDRVVIRCAIGNDKSCGVAKRLGFTHDRIEQQHDDIRDQAIEMNIYHILAEDWQIK
jgi:ribosomal-protein-serine acetyltransferase